MASNYPKFTELVDKIASHSEGDGFPTELFFWDREGLEDFVKDDLIPAFRTYFNPSKEITLAEFEKIVGNDSLAARQARSMVASRWRAAHCNVDGQNYVITEPKNTG